MIVEHVDPAGKARKKTFKTAAKFQARNQVAGKALVFLFGEGFVLRAPQEGPIQWLTQTEEPYPHGFVATWLDGDVWVGDADFLLRVTAGTCEQIDLPLGHLEMPRAICASSTHVHALLDTQSGAPGGKSPFLAPAKGNLAYRAVRVEEEAVKTLFEVPYEPSAAVVGSLSVARDGRLLGPHANGTALYDNGAVARRGLLESGTRAAVAGHGEAGHAGPLGR